MVDTLTETGRCCGMEINVGKTMVMRISMKPSPLQILIDQKQLENVEYINYLSNMTGKDARHTSEIKYRIVMAKAAFNRKKKTFHQQTERKFKE